jgi:hypothetical protein
MAKTVASMCAGHSMLCPYEGESKSKSARLKGGRYEGKGKYERAKSGETAALGKPWFGAACQLRRMASYQIVWIAGTAKAGKTCSIIEVIRGA